MNFEIFVVDNNSSDESIEMLKNKFSDVKLILNEENVGFGRANNQGIKRSRGKFILLLNPDTIIIKDAIQKMCAYIMNQQKIGAVGPKIINDQNDVLPVSMREYPTLLNEIGSLLRFDRIFPNSKLDSANTSKTKFDKIMDVEVLSGACMLLRSQTIKEINGFDEQFFLYGEDVDLCYRIRQNGWQIYYYPHSIVKHLAHKASEKSTDFSPFAVSCRSMYLYFHKNKGMISAISYRVMVALTSALWIFIYTITLRFLQKKPLRKLNIYHDFFKLKWALTSKI